MTAQPPGGQWIVEWRDERRLPPWGPGLPLLDVSPSSKSSLLDSDAVSRFFLYAQANVVLANMKVNFRTR